MAVDRVKEGNDVVAIRLRDLRRRRGLTQEELAERAGVEQPQVSAWEGGRRTPTLENVGKLAVGFGMRHDELLRELGMLDDPPAKNGSGHRPPELPAPLVEALEEMIRKYPGLRAQLEGRPDRGPGARPGDRDPGLDR
jgi:transcriptional regulator with XRE-family HTH domain